LNLDYRNENEKRDPKKLFMFPNVYHFVFAYWYSLWFWYIVRFDNRFTNGI